MHQGGGNNKNQASVREQKYSPDDKIIVPDRFLSGLADPNAGPKDFAEDVNPFGFQCALLQMAV